MDEAAIKHYGKSTAARVDKALLIEHDAAVLLPESLTSHRVIVFCQFTGLLSQLSKRLQLRICELMLALKQQAADCDHKIRGAIAGRYSQVMRNMNISNSDKVNDFLSDIQLLSFEQFDMVIAVRDIFLKTNEKLVDDIKYGGLVFNVSNALIGGIYIYKEHISIEFSNGAGFIDADSNLEGGGKKRRHLKIYSYDDIARKNIKYFVSQAVNN